MSARSERRPTPLGDKVVGLIILGLIIWALLGCTIAPRPVPAQAVAFSGNTQDAGVTGPAPNGAGYLITDAGRARYEELIAEGYGKAMTPPLKPHDGLSELSTGGWVIDKEHLVDWGIMATAKRSGLLP